MRFARTFDRDTIAHLRIPFSFFLLTVFCFAGSQTVSPDWYNLIMTFTILHLFIYPASNAYNSYMDDDRESIGWLEKPPPSTPKLYHASLVLDTAGVFLSFLISSSFAAMVLLYIGVSKAYSWKRIRLKKYPFTSWLVVSLFQGGYTFMMVNMALKNNFTFEWISFQNLNAFGISSVLVGAFYPLTQVYQHKEDWKRDDITISLFLGIRGTFVFSSILFFTGICWMGIYFSAWFSISDFYLFLVFLLVPFTFFLKWMRDCFSDPANANFKNSMLMSLLSAPFLTLFYVLLFLGKNGFL